MAQDTIRLWDWSSIWARLNSVCDVEALARAHGALRRQRKFSSAEDLLRTVLTWAVTGKLLNQTLLVHAKLGGIAPSKQSLCRSGWSAAGRGWRRWWRGCWWRGGRRRCCRRGRW